MSSNLLTVRVFSDLLKFKWRVIFIFLCLVIAKLANFGVPVTLKVIVDSLGQHESENFSIFFPITLIIGYALLSLLATSFNELKEILQSKVALTIFKNMSADILKFLISMPTTFHVSKKTGAIVRDVDRGVRAVQTIIALTMHSVAPVLIELLIIFGYLTFAYDVIFSAICLLMLAAYFAFTAIVTSRWSRKRASANFYESQAAQRANDALLNYEVIKVFNTSDGEVERYKNDLDFYYAESYSAQKIHTLLNVGQQLIIAIAMVSILVLTVFKVSANQMTIGDVVLVNSLIIQLCMPLNLLGITYKEIKQAFVDYRELSKIFSSSNFPEASNIQSAGHEIAKAPEIIFDNVSLVVGETLVLDHATFSIKPGKVTAIVGRSGSGKTSIVRALLRLYDCNEGQILLNGSDILRTPVTTLRDSIGYVSQEITLFNDTIFYNIAYGAVNVGYSEVINIAKKVGLHDFIAALPGGYETPVGERGLMLSGGQKQRVALARALIRRPNILIFDEATSALDVQSDSILQAEIEELVSGKTVLVVTHKLLSVVDVDSVVVLDEAKVLGQGTHEQLLVNNEVYKAMWAAQAKG